MLTSSLYKASAQDSKFSGVDLRPSTLLEKQQGEQGACQSAPGQEHSKKRGEKTRA